MTAAEADLPILRISPARGRLVPSLLEAWDHRELLYFLTWRDIKVRYKQTALGASWAILQPTLTMIVFAIFFGRLAKIPSDNIPYPLFVFCALVPWQLFTFALTGAANSLISNEHLVTKVYFPRLLLPIASVAAGLVDFLIALGVLGVLMAYYGIEPTKMLLLLPLFVTLAVATAATVGLALSALSVRFRDVRYALPFLTQIWLFATPIAYPSSLVPAEFRSLMGINPMAGVVDGFRWVILGAPAPGPMLLVSVVVVVVAFALAAGYFMRVERSFADVL